MASHELAFNIMRDLDSKMVKFFHSVLRHEFKKKKKRQSYSEAMEEVIKAYSKETINSGNSKIQFNSPTTRCAYVFMWGACMATATAYHFLQLLKDNAALLRGITFSDSFHLCCLGGGPGTEIAAVAKILEGMIRDCCPGRRRPLVIKATVIDIDSGWSVTANNLVGSLCQLVDTSLVQCDLKFVAYNLTAPFTRQVADVIGEADFVTMVGFLSAVRGSKFKSRSDQMLQEIVSTMKQDGTLFFMDSLSSTHFDAFRKTMGSFLDMAETYGPLERDLYKMSAFSVADTVRLNKKYFGTWVPPVMTVNYVSAWSKGTNRNDLSKSPTAVDGADDIRAWRKGTTRNDPSKSTTAADDVSAWRKGITRNDPSKSSDGTDDVKAWRKRTTRNDPSKSPTAVDGADDVSAWRKGITRNDPPKSPTVVDSADSKQKAEAKRHLSKSLKFCVPRPGDENDFERECTFQDICMFRTKSKDKRFEGTFEI